MLRSPASHTKEFWEQGVRSTKPLIVEEHKSPHLSGFRRGCIGTSFLAQACGLAAGICTFLRRQHGRVLNLSVLRSRAMTRAILAGYLGLNEEAGSKYITQDMGLACGGTAGASRGDPYHQHGKVGQMVAQAGCLCVSANCLAACTAPAPSAAC